MGIVMKEKLSVVIPAYNEEKRIGKTIERTSIAMFLSM